MWAEQVSMAEDSELCLLRMLLIFVKRTDTQGKICWPLPLSFSYGEEPEAGSEEECVTRAACGRIS